MENSVVEEFKKHLEAAEKSGGTNPNVLFQNLTDLEQEWEQELIENASSYRVVIFSGKFSGSDERLVYHFHFLLSEYCEKNVALCLDTNEMLPLSTRSPSASEMEASARELLNSFSSRIEYLSSKRRDHLSAANVFTRSKQNLWNKFNELKEGSFVEYIRGHGGKGQQEFVLDVVLDEKEISKKAV